ncbi:type III pantothenate kinase [Fibrella sp. HMF5335]|uniref:Type III pantothenate kinase n=1 Tax=Fibrella rubiginis TaxID=2817060 RepID=A0A939K626_9BACT|nr:type III pantothenate kinase [Fibrella rubiginis]MBO0938393.1 type III pantothenate kinase [Fibrella rubiginis]
MTLAIDWGNTRLKTGWFNNDTLVETGRFNSPDLLRQALLTRPADHVIVSSTNRPADELRADLALFDNAADWLILDPDTPLPIRNGYGTPQTLGADRLAGAAGAVSLFPNQPCLIFDLGTCLTADFVSADGTFQGGLIAPGFQMRLQAMHTFTQRLPLITRAPDEEPPITAKNTHDAMLGGVLHGMTFELDGLLTAYTNQHPDLRVIVCGGDGSLFLNRLKPGIFAVPELVLRGLNHILRFNRLA